MVEDLHPSHPDFRENPMEVTAATRGISSRVVATGLLLMGLITGCKPDNSETSASDPSGDTDRSGLVEGEAAENQDVQNDAETSGQDVQDSNTEIAGEQQAQSEEQTPQATGTPTFAEQGANGEIPDALQEQDAANRRDLEAKNIIWSDDNLIETMYTSGGQLAYQLTDGSVEVTNPETEDAQTYEKGTIILRGYVEGQSPEEWLFIYPSSTLDAAESNGYIFDEDLDKVVSYAFEGEILVGYISNTPVEIISPSSGQRAAYDAWKLDNTVVRTRDGFGYNADNDIRTVLTEKTFGSRIEYNWKQAETVALIEDPLESAPYGLSQIELGVPVSPGLEWQITGESGWIYKQSRGEGQSGYSAVYISDEYKEVALQAANDFRARAGLAPIKDFSYTLFESEAGRVSPAEMEQMTFKALAFASAYPDHPLVPSNEAMSDPVTGLNTIFTFVQEFWETHRSEEGIRIFNPETGEQERLTHIDMANGNTNGEYGTTEEKYTRIALDGNFTMQFVIGAEGTISMGAGVAEPSIVITANGDVVATFNMTREQYLEDVGGQPLVSQVSAGNSIAISLNAWLYGRGNTTGSASISMMGRALEVAFHTDSRPGDENYPQAFTDQFEAMNALYAAWETDRNGPLYYSRLNELTNKTAIQVNPEQ